MKIKDTLTDELKKHFKSKWPREFGHKFELSFVRNERVNDQYEVKNLLEWYDFKDCFCSVYAFRDWSDLSVVRKQSARVDCIVFDLDSEDLRIAFKEAKLLVEYLLGIDAIPRVYFSGMKGFHIYVDFLETEIKNLEAVKRLGVRIGEELNLTTLDPKVFEVARLIRIPFSKHSGSGLRCIPIKPEKFIKMDLISLMSFVKYSFSPIEVYESKEFAKELRYEDFKISTNAVLRDILRKKIRPRRRKKGSGWKEKRIRRYTEALRKYGRLTADPEISKIHGGNEHYARLHFHCLLIEAGYSDSEIHDLFRLFEDYNERKVEYYLKYNREWLERRKKVIT